MGQFIIAVISSVLLILLILVQAIINNSMRGYLICIACLIFLFPLFINLLKPKSFTYNDLFLDSDAILQIGGIGEPVQSIAERFCPTLSYGYDNEQADFMGVFYKSAQRGNTLSFIYYFWWNDEVAPNFLIHFFYKLFRILYYGSAADIEFIQLDIDMTSGRIVRALFEAPVIRPHRIYHSRKQIFFNEQAQASSGSPALSLLPQDHQRLHFVIKTWNHLFGIDLSDLASDRPICYAKGQISPLTKEIFFKFNMFRRGNGDF